LKIRTAGSDLVAENAWGEFAAEAQKVTTEIDDNYANDFNTSGALAALFTLIRDFNRTAALPRASGTPGAVLGASAFLKVLHEEIGAVLGIGRQDPEKGAC
jgi:cysteinyl-tRNA synthetase